jgi:RNA polymerase subunit RPABC4/transcription elongation factor Spt4
MALKKCKECGTEISSEAKTCPKCGKPSTATSLQGLGCALTIIGLVIILLVLAISGLL